MNLLFLDVETYYDRDLTLTKLNYTEYVRNTEVQLVGIFYQNKLQTLKDPSDLFNTLDWPNITLVGHNLLFDAAVLHHFYGHQAGRYIDTLGMARALYPCSKHGLGDLAKQFDCPIQKGNLNTKGQREPDLKTLGEYCAKDVLITHFLYHHLKPEFDRYLGPDELDLMNHTIKLWLNPIIELDHTKLADIVREEAEEKQRLLDGAGMTIEQMRSNAQFAQHLESMGYEPPTKWSVKQNKLVYAFAKADIQLYAEENPELKPLLSLKSQCNSNIKESRALRLANSITHKKQVPIAYNYHGAFTGRFSSTNRLNMANLPRGGAIRHCLHAPKGHMLIVSDLAQIEARMLAWLANEEFILDAFRNKKDLYCEAASKIFNKPINKKDHPDERWVGKCLGEHTIVLTHRGWCPILQVRATDLLWDGITWVRHKGLAYQGNQWTLSSQEVTATSSHLILTAEGWQTWADVLTNPSLFQSALKLANLPYSIGNPAPTVKASLEDGIPQSDVPVVGKAPWIELTLQKVTQHAATLAVKLRDALNGTGYTKAAWLTTPIELAYSTDAVLQSPAATTQITDNISPTENEELPSIMNGDSILRHFSSIYKHWKDGITLNWKWIASTITKATNLVTFASVRDKRTSTTEEPCKRYQHGLPSSKKNVPTYDLLSAGPNRRFTIWSSQGPIIVHNSVILGAGYGMGATKFRIFCKSMGRELTESYCQELINKYRNSYQAITSFWQLMQTYLPYFSTTTPLHILRSMLTIKNNRLFLPSGRAMHYEEIQYNEDTNSYRLKNNKKVYGALAVENITQGAARDIFVHQLRKIHNTITPVIMHSYDELICIAPEAEAETTAAAIQELMCQPPDWCKDLPLDAETSVAFTYGEAK